MRCSECQRNGVPSSALARGAAGADDPLIGRRFWGTPLTPLVRPDLVALDYRTPIAYREVLVCRGEWVEHAELLRLLDAIRQALSLLSLEGVGREWIEVA